MKILKPRDSKRMHHYLIGAVLIVANYIRHSLLGYKTPRTFSSGQFVRQKEKLKFGETVALSLVWIKD